ncbi:hypothetical protein CF326_g3712 [Tilletia indica]|nr:hypothetical protein CF326_g3712 [Tilletia indica]
MRPSNPRASTSSSSQGGSVDPTSPARTRRHTRTQASITSPPPTDFWRGQRSASYSQKTSNEPTSAESRRVQTALAQSEDMLRLADTVINLNTSVHQLSDHLDTIRTFVTSLPRPEASECTVSTTEQLEIGQSLSRDYAALFANAAKLKRIANRPEAILTLGDAARAEIALLSIFRRLEDLAARIRLTSASASSLVARSGRPLVASVPADVPILAEGAIPRLRSQVMEQLHERVGQLVQAELDTFSRFVRAVLDGGLRAVRNGEQGRGVGKGLPQPEIDPLGFLFTELEEGPTQPNASSSSTHSGSISALQYSRNLNATLKTRLHADSKLLETILAAVTNAAGRLGARINAWAIGLTRVYVHLNGIQKDRDAAAAASLEADAKSTTVEEGGLQEIGRLKERYNNLARSAVERLLSELEHQVTWHTTADEPTLDHAEEYDYKTEVAAKAVFGYKVIDSLHRRRAILRVLVQQEDSERSRQSEEAIQLTLEESKMRCLESWRTLTLDRAVSEHNTAVRESEEPDGVEDDETDSVSMPIALLHAIEVLKAGVYELGLAQAGSYLPASPSLVSAFVERLQASRKAKDGESTGSSAQEAVNSLKAIVEGRSQESSVDGQHVGRVIRMALGPLLVGP